MKQAGPRPVPRETIDDPCRDAYQCELDYILRTLQRLGVDRHDVEDLAHEVYLVLRRTWHEYNPTRTLRSYIFGVAFRVASSHRRRYWREVSFASVEAPDHAPRPDQALDSARARALVLASVQRIPLLRRAVLIMHDLDEIPIRDVAATLQIPLFTAYSRLRKARREMEIDLAHLRTGGSAHEGG
ncbi:MAG TPA: sigma-70 family RNA polymerase sigma factor [Polyangia bacterium]|nr:sigma-70 family RNA polymerase sigma factor [Polyangia bacterium]